MNIQIQIPRESDTHNWQRLAFAKIVPLCEHIKHLESATVYINFVTDTASTLEESPAKHG
jgi:hypothetical protein